MQAMSMIDTSVNALETVAPAKPAEPQGKQFGKVLNEQRQPEQDRPAAAKQQVAEKPQMKQVQKQAAKPVAKQEGHPAEQPKVENQIVEQPVAASAEVPVEVKPKLQQIVMSLMKAIAGTETPEMTDGIVADEEVASIEELLTQLVEQLDRSELKGSGLEGEQVLAGLDLTVLVEQLQALKQEGGEEQLEQLVEQLAVQLEKQVVGEDSLQKNAELAAAAMPTLAPQEVAPKLVENLAQARQILQKVIDSVAPQKTSEVVTEETVLTDVETEKAGQDLLFGADTAEEIDPRFAGLLKPRTENRMQQQQVQGNNATTPEQVKGEAAQVVTDVQPEQAEVADFVQQLGSLPKQQGLENLIQQAQGQVQPAAGLQPQQMAGKVMPETPMVQLPSGQQVAESQIFDQVVARFSSSMNGDAKRMVLRMQPAELGSLKIELIVEGDRVRANLQAQSLQVQEVLERNLPQLRNALAEQGLKIDQFQVDVNRDQSQQQQFQQLAQQQQQRRGEQSRPQWQQPWETEEQIVPLAHLMQNGGGGISLHV